MRRLLTGSAFVLLLVASSAATVVPKTESPSWEGETFLSDYTNLKPVPVLRGTEYVYVAPGTDEKLAAYTAVMVDQPEVSFSAVSPHKSAKPDDLKAIAEFLRSTVTERLTSRGCSVVEQKGASVLYLRLALTDLQLKKKKRGILAYTPAGAVVHAVKTAVQNVMGETDIMDLTMQAELLDSQTGEIFGAIVTRRAAESKKEGGKPKPIEFDEFETILEAGSDRLACRVNNARLPADQRINCTTLGVPAK